MSKISERSSVEGAKLFQKRERYNGIDDPDLVLAREHLAEMKLNLGKLEDADSKTAFELVSEDLKAIEVPEDIIRIKLEINSLYERLRELSEEKKISEIAPEKMLIIKSLQQQIVSLQYRLDLYLRKNNKKNKE